MRAQQGTRSGRGAADITPATEQHGLRRLRRGSSDGLTIEEFSGRPSSQPKTSRKRADEGGVSKFVRKLLKAKQEHDQSARISAKGHLSQITPTFTVRFRQRGPNKGVSIESDDLPGHLALVNMHRHSRLRSKECMKKVDFELPSTEARTHFEFELSKTVKLIKVHEGRGCKEHGHIAAKNEEVPLTNTQAALILYMLENDANGKRVVRFEGVARYIESLPKAALENATESLSKIGLDVTSVKGSYVGIHTHVS